MRRIVILVLISTYLQVASGIERDYPLSPPLKTLVQTYQNLEIKGERIIWAQQNKQSSNFGGKLKIVANKRNMWRKELVANESRRYKLLYVTDGVENVIFEENTDDSAYVSLLNKVSMPYTEDFIIVESSDEYREAAGIHDIYYLHLYFLTMEGAIKGITIETDERRYKYGEDYNSSDYDVSFVYDNKDNFYIYLSSATEKKLLKVNSSTKTVENLSDHLSLSTPSYSCSGKLKYLEYLICKTPGLASMDRVVNHLYTIKKSSDETKESQLRWLAERNMCRSLPEEAVLTCLSEKYEKRIYELNAL